MALEIFHCVICKEVAVRPTVIKHCLHFFCKDCIESQIQNYSKDCPLCKQKLATKRECRPYDKMAKILALLKPALDRANVVPDWEQI